MAARARLIATGTLLIAWWLLIGVALNVGITWTLKALADRGLARGPRWAATVLSPWPYDLPPSFTRSPDERVRITEWWRTQDIGSWRADPSAGNLAWPESTHIVIEESYGLPMRGLGGRVVEQFGGPMGLIIVESPGVPTKDTVYDDLATRPRWFGFAFNSIFYGALAWLFLRGRHAWHAHRRRRAGLCPGCARPWPGATNQAACDLCTQWANQPRRVNRYWWRTTLSAPAWLISGAFIAVCVAWGGPHVARFTGDHFISRPRRPAQHWPASYTRAAGRPDVVDRSDCWWGSHDDFQQGSRLVRLVRVGTPFACFEGTWDASPVPAPGMWLGYSGPTRYFTGPIASAADVWTVTVPKVGDLTFPHRPLWSGLLLNTLFWSATCWTLWRGPAALRRWRWRRAGRCGTCGYELVGLPEGSRCPECGTVPAPMKR